MKKKLCTRCGQCCLHAPCFFISFGKEKYTEDGKHDCPYLYWKDNLAICKIYESGKEIPNGFCSSSIDYNK